jgi:hypothetical protein
LRIPKLELDPDPGYEPREGEEVVIAVDGTGIKVSNRGEWMRKGRKGYIKIHVAVDTKTKQVVSLEVSDERTDDGEKLVPLVRGPRGGRGSRRSWGIVAMTPTRTSNSWPLLGSRPPSRCGKILIPIVGKGKR